MQLEVWQHRTFQQFQPKKELSALQQKLKDSNPITLEQYIEYCYYTILKASRQIEDYPPSLSKQTRQNIREMNKHSVNANNMPCLIYEHLSETFYSLVQAWNDNDLELVKQQISEIKSTIASFNVNKQYGAYESFNHLEIDQNYADCVLKEKFVKDIQQIFKQCENSSSKSKKPRPKNRNVGNMIKQKQAQLNQRHEQRVKPILSKLLSRIKIREQESKNDLENEERQFVLMYGINKHRILN